MAIARAPAIAGPAHWPTLCAENVSRNKACVHIPRLCSIAIAITTPIAIQVVIETVQSACASEPPALFDCIRLGLERVWTELTSLATSMPSRQTVPVWQLLVPTIAHRLAHYLLAGAVHYGVRKVVSALATLCT